jgi:hypothetical protein
MTDRIRRYLIDDYTRDYYSGALLLLVGLCAVAQGITYNVGSLTQMGPGFFPVALGVILALLGIAIAGTARRASSTATETEKLPAEWRGWICILLSIVAFVVLGKYGGLLPATFAIVFISALGDRQNTIRSALAFALSTSAVCVVIFWWALQLRFPLFTWG